MEDMDVVRDGDMDADMAADMATDMVTDMAVGDAGDGDFK